MALAVGDVCRLCLSTDDLAWIFNEDNVKLKMKEIVSITTGIEIHIKDIISQKICGKCYQFSIKMLQFRGQCLNADKYLKSLCMDYLVDKKHYIPNTEVTIKSVVKVEDEKKPKPIYIKRPPIHTSIVKLSKTYPETKLPRICLDCDVAPVVELEMDQVENYFKTLKLDFKRCVKKALHRSNMSMSRIKSSRVPKSPKQKNVLNKVDAKRSKPLDRENRKSGEPEEQIIGRQCKTPDKNMLDPSPKSPSISRAKGKGPNKEKVPKTSLKTIDSKPDTNIRKRKLKIEKNSNSTKADAEIESVVYPSNIVDNDKLERCENHLKSDCDKLGTGLSLSCPGSPTKKRRKEMTVDKSNTTNPHQCHYTDKEIGNGCDLKGKPNEELLLTKAASKPDLLDGNDVCDSLTCVGKSVPLFVCHICNSVQYNMHELKKHQVKHMRCQFCKIRCRSLEQKVHHVENSCMIKKMMIDLPHVVITRIDRNIIVRQKYPNAFVDMPSLSCAEISGVNIISFKKNLFKDFPPERLNVIEILSDDDTL